MIPYIIITSISLLITLLADMAHKRSKRFSVFILIINILALSFFAAARNKSVGTDLSVYGIDVFSNPFKIERIESGYSLLNYIIRLFTTNFNVFLFVHQAILSTLITIIAYREKKEKNTPLCLFSFAYILIWYCVSFNILRQSIALVILLSSFKYLERGENKKYAISCIFASFFHQSSLIYIAVIPIYKIIGKKLKLRTALLTIIFALLFFINIEQIFTIIQGIIPLLDKYSVYIMSSRTNFQIKFMVAKLLLLGLELFTFGMLTKDDKNKLKPLILFALMDCLLYLSSAFILFGYRASYFFLVHHILLIPRLISYTHKKESRLILTVAFIVILSIYWYVRHVIAGYDGIIPYKF